MLQLSGWTLTLSVLTLLFIALLYFKVVRPYQQFRFYRKILSSSYKTLVHPFDVFGLGTFGRSRKDLLKHGDSDYTLKVQYPSYQISLANFKGSTYVDLIDPQLIKEFYEKQMEGCYVKYVTSPFLSTLKHILGEGLLFSEGENWKLKRKIMSQVFNYDFIKSRIGPITEICQDMLDQFQKSEINKDKKDVKIDVNHLFTRIFGNVVVRSFFGDIQLDKIEDIQIFAYVNGLFELNTKRSLDLFAFFAGNNFYEYNLRKADRKVSGRIAKFEKFAQQTILGQIQKIKEQGQSKQGKFNGVIELLVKQNRLKEAVSKEDQHERNYYTVNQLIQQFTTFFFAGTDTTTNSTTMMVYLLAQHPKVQAKVRQEIDQIFPSPLNVKDVTFENLRKLTYFDDVMKETLRMYSPVAGLGPRLAVKDHHIGSIPIKKGMMIGVKMRPNHFKEEFYPNPQQFNPQRWSMNDPTKAEQFSFFPFSSGRRNCIGQHLALLESKIAVITLLKRYKRITLEKQDFKKSMRTLYGAENMTTTFQKFSESI